MAVDFEVQKNLSTIVNTQTAFDRKNLQRWVWVWGQRCQLEQEIGGPMMLMGRWEQPAWPVGGGRGFLSWFWPDNYSHFFILKPCKWFSRRKHNKPGFFILPFLSDLEPRVTAGPPKWKCSFQVRMPASVIFEVCLSISHFSSLKFSSAHFCMSLHFFVKKEKKVLIKIHQHSS